MRLVKRIRNDKGFTLVEIIVVLIIVGILATLAVPSLTSYMDKANSNAILIEAETVYSAAKTAASEEYAKYGDLITKFRAVSGGPKIRGRVTDYMLCCVQRGDNVTDADKKFDVGIAKSVLKKLESYNVTKPRYKFKNTNNGLNSNVVEYEKRYGQPLLIISYTAKGDIDFIEFGYNGYLAHVTEDTKWVKKNATSARYPDS